ncbi:uncharacterized protein LOC120653334 [Panicum virgatum]|uniref:uncharacterized protein LOC120653334 n=1 Tax=Panicum virgatum TaxID=38727 RepID=UPI0019D65707|nr:uncharacterized protein LOC120653334 [Panicum virgatum]
MMAALDMYWDYRRLPLLVTIYDTLPLGNSHQQTSQSIEPDVEAHAEANNRSDHAPSDSDFDSDSSVNDELLVDDEAGCDVLEHVTNLENPTIALNETFEDGDTFKRAIRQYAVLNEFEIAAPYSERTRYRGHCKGTQSKGKRCKWRIHASELQDGQTWQIKRLVDKQACASRAKVDHNSMATNAWVRDRVIDILREEPTTGAAALKKMLEKKYNIKLSYYVAWDGKEMALEQIMGKWDDSFEDAFRFKVEVERTNPGSLVEIDHQKIGNKVRFTRMFVALKTCVDGFLTGCRPFLGVDSTILTGRWRGQLASASTVDGHNWLFPVAYAVFESESSDNWKWFFERLQIAIGSPPGLVICTDAGKGIDNAVTSVFSNGVEHKECMRHLVKNFQKSRKRQLDNADGATSPTPDDQKANKLKKRKVQNKQTKKQLLMNLLSE